MIPSPSERLLSVHLLPLAKPLRLGGTALLASLAAVVSLALSGIVRTYALRHDLLDHPNARSSHQTPTPRGGGLAVLAASALGMAIGWVFGLVLGRDALTLSVGMVLLGVVGWIDDRRGVSAGARLAVHFAVAVWTMFMLHGLPAIRLGSAIVGLGNIGYLLGIIAIVWAINLFNFMDGIDGLAGSQAVIVLGAATLLFLSRSDQSLGAISAVVAAASAGFLIWNWPPAKIFMGDVGSGALGYLIAGLALASESRGSVPLLVFIILEGVFILDATVTLSRRILRGNRAAEAHRDHAYQRLSRAWGRHRPVTLAAAVVALVLSVLAAIGTVMPKLLLPLFIASYALLGILFLAVERRAPMSNSQTTR